MGMRTSRIVGRSTEGDGRNSHTLEDSITRTTTRANPPRPVIIVPIIVVPIIVIPTVPMVVPVLVFSMAAVPVVITGVCSRR